ncbi:MAG: hypothetical protein J0G28_00770 [Afipia sp.]|nr:hypothetical protein [Afipia sp.]OJW65898.1 MAG: hypothetical protein BGO65_02145 [Afipia sp. 64-13]
MIAPAECCDELSGTVDLSHTQQICDLVAEKMGFDCSFMGQKGVILASNLRGRIGTVHAAAARVMAGEVDQFEVTADMAAASKGTMREGINMPVNIDGKRIGSYGLAGPLDTVRPFAYVITSLVGSVIALRIQDVSRTNHISLQVTKATGVAATAAKAADEAAKAMLFLSETTSRIGDVATTIGKVAKQTNLLALNATIEAGRAGNMGVGFAVVAQEVKLLSGQTAKATTDIGGQIGKVQGAVGEMRRAVEAMNDSIRNVSAIVTEIADTIQEPQ